MAVITTAQISYLVDKFKSIYPNLNFVKGDDFLWRHQNKTIYYNVNGDANYFLHELGHALLCHQSYDFDINLLNMEREAWQKARQIAKSINLEIDEDIAQDSLDTYRRWFRARSSCPSCESTGLQISKTEYSCPSCSTVWRVNQAKNCQLRRYIKKPARKHY